MSHDLAAFLIFFRVEHRTYARAFLSFYSIITHNLFFSFIRTILENNKELGMFIALERLFISFRLSYKH
jgi:hypothetical protein